MKICLPLAAAAALFFIFRSSSEPDLTGTWSLTHVAQYTWDDQVEKSDLNSLVEQELDESIRLTTQYKLDEDGTCKMHFMVRESRAYLSETAEGIWSLIQNGKQLLVQLDDGKAEIFAIRRATRKSVELEPKDQSWDDSDIAYIGFSRVR